MDIAMLRTIVLGAAFGALTAMWAPDAHSEKAAVLQPAGADETVVYLFRYGRFTGAAFRPWSTMNRWLRLATSVMSGWCSRRV